MDQDGSLDHIAWNEYIREKGREWILRMSAWVKYMQISFQFFNCYILNVSTSSWFYMYLYNFKIWCMQIIIIVVEIYFVCENLMWSTDLNCFHLLLKLMLTRSSSLLGCSSRNVKSCKYRPLQWTKNSHTLMSINDELYKAIKTAKILI